MSSNINNHTEDTSQLSEKFNEKEKEEERNENVVVGNFNSSKEMNGGEAGGGGGGGVSKSMNLTDKERSDRKANESLGSRLENPLYVRLSRLLFTLFVDFSKLR